MRGLSKGTLPLWGEDHFLLPARLARPPQISTACFHARNIYLEYVTRQRWSASREKEPSTGEVQTVAPSLTNLLPGPRCYLSHRPICNSWANCVLWAIAWEHSASHRAVLKHWRKKGRFKSIHSFYFREVLVILNSYNDLPASQGRLDIIMAKKIILFTFI